MPHEIKIGRNAMIDGAIGIIEERGFEAVSARAVAERLGISTQPIYREFGGMDGMRRAASERGFEIFAEYVAGDALDQAVRYVTFAAERGKLFDFLFRGSGLEYGGLDELSHSLVAGTDIIEKLGGITGLERERVYRLHLLLWMALHGLASFAADNTLPLSEDDVKRFALELTRALSYFYGKEGNV